MDFEIEDCKVKYFKIPYFSNLKYNLAYKIYAGLNCVVLCLFFKKMCWVVSMVEIFDVYNRKGEICGQASREEIHQKGLWHKVVIGYIINDKLQVLLQRRSKTRQYPNVWDASAGGHVICGENVEEAIAREFKEEIEFVFANTGYSVISIKKDVIFFVGQQP